MLQQLIYWDTFYYGYKRANLILSVTSGSGSFTQILLFPALNDSEIQPNKKILLLWRTAFIFSESALLIFLTSIAITLCHCRLLCYCVAEAEKNVDFALCTNVHIISTTFCWFCRHRTGFEWKRLVIANGWVFFLRKRFKFELP